MDKKDYRIKGHESFILREGWLTKGLKAVADDARVFSKNNGADALGVGTNMAKAIRYWLRAAGLTHESQRDGVVLSDLGNVIYNKDPYFEDVFSLWIVHVNIAMNFRLATSWNVFFNNIDVTTFRRDELFNMMQEKLVEIIGETNIPERSVKDDCSAIISMYSDGREDTADPEEKRKSPFAMLGLIHEIENGMYEKCRPAVDTLNPLIVLYIISGVLAEEKVLSIDEVVSGENMPGKLLNLNRVTINDCLDALQHKGYIIVNRTAGLDVIYPDGNVTAMNAVIDYYKGSTNL